MSSTGGGRGWSGPDAGWARGLSALLSGWTASCRPAPRAAPLWGNLRSRAPGRSGGGRRAAPGSRDIDTVLSNLGAAITLGLGLLGLFAPERAARLVSVRPVDRLGRSEIRATYGGLFAALGLACLLTQAPAAFLAAGIAWLGAAAGRTFSAVVDASRSRANLGAVAFELAVGLLLLA